MSYNKTYSIIVRIWNIKFWCLFNSFKDSAVSFISATLVTNINNKQIILQFNKILSLFWKSVKFFYSSHHRCPFLLSCSQVVYVGVWLTNSWKRRVLMVESLVQKVVVVIIKAKVVCIIISNMNAASILSSNAITVVKVLLVIVTCEDICLFTYQGLWKRKLRMITVILYGFITLILNTQILLCNYSDFVIK